MLLIYFYLFTSNMKAQMMINQGVGAQGEAKWGKKWGKK